MCSYVDLTNVPEGGFTANEKIRCYKVLVLDTWYNTMVSPIVNREYRVGEKHKNAYGVRLERSTASQFYIYNNALKIFENGIFDINSYFIKNQIDKGLVITQNTKVKLNITAEGFYTYTHYMCWEMERDITSELFWDKTVFVVECEIPKGSRYYVSDNSETFVSNKLNIKRVAAQFNKEAWRKRNAS